jgi:hypothetical protein
VSTTSPPDEKLSAFVELEREALTLTFYLDSTGKVERIIPFADANRKL